METCKMESMNLFLSHLTLPAYRAAYVGQLGDIDASHIPGERLADGIERVFALIGCQQAVEHTPGHRELQLDLVHSATECITRSNSQVEPTLFARLNGEVVPNVDGYGHHRLRADVVRHEAKVAIGWYKGEQTLRFPALEAHTRME